MDSLFKFLFFLIFLILSSSAFSAQTVPIDINGQSYQIEYWPSYFASELDIKFMDESNIEVNDIDIKFYRGKVIGHPETLVTLSKVDNNLKGLAFFYGRYYEIYGSISKTTIESNLEQSGIAPMKSAVVDIPEMAERANQEICPVHSPELHDMQISARSAINTSTATAGSPPVALAVGNINLAADVAIALDPLYVSTHGGEANAVTKALQTLDMADMFYRQQKPANGAGGLGIALNAVRVNVFSNALPFGVSDILDPNAPNPAPFGTGGDRREIDSIPYLTRIRDNGNALFGNPRTVGALLTGYDLDDVNSPFANSDGVAGIAILTSTCSANGVSLSEGWNGDSFNAVVTAHEIAHNFGSCHDGEDVFDAANNICPLTSANCPTGVHIMSPFVVAAATQFSECSIANINTHIVTQTCYKQPIDIQITLQNLVPAMGVAITQGNTSVRTLTVENMTDVALMNINISGTLENPDDPLNNNAEYTTVTLEGNACAIAGNRQTYTCTIPSIDGNNAETLTIIETVTATGTGQSNSRTEYKNNPAEQRVDVEPQNSIVELTVNINTPNAAPIAPSNVQATARTNGDIFLSWTDNSNNEDAFIIERNIVNTANSTVIIAPNLPPNSTSYLDTNTVVGTTYSYQLSASNGIGATAAATIPTATSTVSTVSTASGGGGGGGGAFYLLPLVLFFARALSRHR